MKLPMVLVILFWKRLQKDGSIRKAGLHRGFRGFLYGKVEGRWQQNGILGEMVPRAKVTVEEAMVRWSNVFGNFCRKGAGWWHVGGPVEQVAGEYPKGVPIG